jgi:membrane protein YqaA with SNARE-associated domain
MMRKTIAVIAGALIGTFTLFVVGIIANALFSTPPELMDPATPETVTLRVASTPLFTWLTTILGLTPGSFFGGYTGTRIAKEKQPG